MGRLSTDEYLAGAETNRPQELAYGLLREPPAPGFHHQIIVARIHVQLDRHVRRYGLGLIVESPVDVILDRERALVVQPDVVFISNGRRAIATDRIWGAPDLAIEVLSRTNRRHDCHRKVGWYRHYDVRECWLVDPDARSITVINLAAADGGARLFDGERTLRSTVLPRLRMRAADAFDDD
jgi:Uma2 family endonuclease